MGRLSKGLHGPWSSLAGESRVKGQCPWACPQDGQWRWVAGGGPNSWGWRAPVSIPSYLAKAHFLSKFEDSLNEAVGEVAAMEGDAPPAPVHPGVVFTGPGAPAGVGVTHGLQLHISLRDI